jgi:hypothetical protein
MKKIFFLILFVCNIVLAENNCLIDSFGRTFCAPTNGSAFKTFTNDIVCSIGKCVTDNLGYLKCSVQQGGGAIVDILGKPQCVGGCVNPSKDLCINMKGEQNK